jgi:TolA-binding protein
MRFVNACFLRSSIGALGAGILVGAASIAPAFAQVDSREGITLQNEIYELRAQVQALRGQRGGGNAPAYAPPPQQYGTNGDLLPQLLSRVDTLEDQVRQLRGRVDELQNTQQQQGADLGKRVDDLSFNQRNGSGQPPPAPIAPSRPSASPQPSAPSPQSPPANRTPEVALQEGNAALTRRDYQGAEAAARQVLANRTSPRAYDANLLLAQALAGQKQYAQAAIQFDDTYNRSRKGSHAQDALVGLATSLNAINEKRAACDTIGRLHSEFPQMRSDIREAANGVSQRADCH